MKIRHRTTYRYSTPVALNAHRLLLRPRDGFAVHVRRCDVTISPRASVVWAEDALGNAVATANFSTPADTLVIESEIELDLLAPPWPVFNIANSAIRYPFAYDADDLRDLGALTGSHPSGSSSEVDAWARDFVAGTETDTLSLLRDINFGIAQGFVYEPREPEGTQTARETLALGRGSCRDFAVLFAEAVRSLGFAARLVSGYYRDSNAGPGPLRSTHAWVEVFLPGGGWIPFDPTNSAMGGFDLVPVAVGRDMGRIMPVTGSYIGPIGSYLGLTVEVFLSD
ncbi:transglutaminase family protein [Oharaeibacter diazotrophicus]|uniref:Transglutaminase-like putative cysteine protease n=1 Tax=Oharaeibacter diazotrophicus TaxID=1920512 RepID=A0A4R6RDF8_9HYPH|nr:transglutaminase family protein [Oharaeibacter diazotrophicus]TDP84233.1 transglutaminase-like putative cysteine protease [Oharaeibacter diazotrophicus]BBE73271.1 transglutaminase-like superfamily protein [Pleomorphomonas sp. SM30]GLS75061.1 transglutaminase [Oharaeibacter diazotrophicus]